MYSDDTLLRLIERIYDAALAPELWPMFLEDLSEVVDGHSANIAQKETRRPEFAVGATARFDPEALRDYVKHFGALDPWVKAGALQGLFRTGGMGLGNSLVRASEYRQTEFYSDFGRRYAINGGFSVIIRMAQVARSPALAQSCSGLT